MSRTMFSVHVQTIQACSYGLLEALDRLVKVLLGLVVQGLVHIGFFSKPHSLRSKMKLSTSIFLPIRKCSNVQYMCYKNSVFFFCMTIAKLFSRVVVLRLHIFARIFYIYLNNCHGRVFQECTLYNTVILGNNVMLNNASVEIT